MEFWLILVLFSAMLLAAFMLMLRRDVMHEHNTQVFSFMYFPFLILIPLLSRWSGEPIEHAVFREFWLLFLVGGVAVAVSLYCNAKALKRLPLTVVGPLRNLSPFFVALLGLFLLGQQLSPINIAGLVVIVAGVILLDVDIRHPSNISGFLRDLKNPATFLLVLAAICISFSPIIAKVILEETNIFTFMYYQSMILLFIYWVVHIAMHRSLPSKGLSVHEILWLLLTGVTLFLADVFYFLAIAFPGALVAVIFGVRRLSNLFVTVFGGAVMHEQNGLYKAAVCLVMVAGTILLVL